MLLNEVTENPVIIKLIAITDQLKSDIEDKKLKNDMSVTSFLNHLADYDITLDKSDLYSMIKKPPLKKFIANIENNKVIFKGKEKPKTEKQVDKNKEIVKQMAQSATKK